MYRITPIAIALILLSGAAFTQGTTPYTAAEMSALLAKGLTVTSSDLQGGREFTGRTQLTADGKISGSVTPAGAQPISYTGTWKLNGARLCRTLVPIQPDEVCETWLKTGNKQATVVVNGKEASINRWQ
jgi:hypothetical protein